MDDASFSRLRRQPGYPLFYATATITRLADDMFSVGTVLLVLERTGSAAVAGATIAAVTFPSIATGPLLGAWLDRTGSRRRIMILDQMLAASTLVAIVLLAGHAANWVLPIVALGAGITWPLSFGGFTSFIPVIVSQELLPRANALEATSFNVALITGPALAGTIAAIAGPAASLLVEAALTVGAIGLIARLPALDVAVPKRKSRSLREIARNGLRHIAVVPPLRSVTAAGALSLGGLGLLTVAFLRRRRPGRTEERRRLPLGGVRRRVGIRGAGARPDADAAASGPHRARRHHVTGNADAVLAARRRVACGTRPDRHIRHRRRSRLRRDLYGAPALDPA
jgi:MFS family permease